MIPGLHLGHRRRRDRGRGLHLRLARPPRLYRSDHIGAPPQECRDRITSAYGRIEVSYGYLAVFYARPYYGCFRPLVITVTFSFKDAPPGVTPIKPSAVSELLRQRAAIDAMLPATELGDLNLDRELVRQYIIAQELQSQVIDDLDTPANQKAQVLNACANTLVELQRAQERYFRSERFKKIEMILIRCLRTLPPETVEAFMTEYERTLKEEV